MKRAIALRCALAASTTAQAHETGPGQTSRPHEGGIAIAPAKAVPAPFDIIHTKISTEGNVAVFHMAVSGRAGESKPAVTGKFEGSEVFSYVWPTNIDPYEVGFERGTGILALAVTSHPDFDDIAVVDKASFDGVTAGLRVAASPHSPLLCVANVFKVASGDLSLPGRPNR